MKQRIVRFTVPTDCAAIYVQRIPSFTLFCVPYRFGFFGFQTPRIAHRVLDSFALFSRSACTGRGSPNIPPVEAICTHDPSVLFSSGCDQKEDIGCNRFGLEEEPVKKM